MPEEIDWQKRFPVLQVFMRKTDVTIELADDKANHKVKVPAEVFDSWVESWRRFRDGTNEHEIEIGRWYTGEWPK